MRNYHGSVRRVDHPGAARRLPAVDPFPSFRCGPYSRPAYIPFHAFTVTSHRSMASTTAVE